MKRTVTGLSALVLFLAMVLPTVQPAQAQAGVVWNAIYYNDAYQLSDPVLTRQETALDFNWGGGSPAPGINADNFSATFWSDIYFAPGTYRFYIKADDGVRLFVGQRATWGEPVIDTYNNPQPSQLLATDVTFTGAGMEHVVINYREATGDAYLYVTWENLAGAPSGPNFPQPVSSMGDWTAQYYKNIDLAGAPDITRQETIPSHDWGTGAPLDGFPIDNFSARWSLARPMDAGTYTINVQADDGVRVFLDNVPVINEWHQATGQVYSYTFTTGATYHGFVIEYYESAEDAYLHFALTQAQTPAPAQPSTAAAAPAAPTGATATITAYRLNVRDLPGTTGSVITHVQRGEVYAIVGRTTDSGWWLINVNGTLGWVSASYVTPADTQSVPVTYEGTVG